MRKALAIVKVALVIASFGLLGCPQGLSPIDPPTGKTANFGATSKTSFGGSTRGTFVIPEVFPSDATDNEVEDL